ncbi:MULTISPECIES: ABC transporter substrate-binding protein [unclassified Duganella]|uniref:ABC transporter substrate-binding protein n=1 Tax=unclassified Duganella TaxID=2636909 RepID=UPI0013EEC2C1|nr:MULTISPECIES: extracellular solute-binding protein [unclassified Duganella]
MYAALALPGVCIAEDLTIDYVISNSPQRSAWISIINQFAAANPDLKVTHCGYPQEQYKREFLTRLQSGSADLAFWYAGERLRDAAKNKLLSPLDAEMLALLKKQKFVTTAIESTRIDGDLYGFPLYYYAWGFIYRKSLFERVGVRPPATWSEFLQVCEQLKAAGVTPLGLGAKSVWPAAGWFDYLNLRINGLDFHHKLLNGDVRFTDARFTTAMAQDFGFFAFPALSPTMPAYEEAPLDVLVLPANGPNPKARKRFLTFLAESGALRQMADADQTLPAKAGTTSANVLLAEVTGATVANAAGLTHFFDRDARAELVAPVYEGLRQFLKAPHDTEQAVRYIEQARRKDLP